MSLDGFHSEDHAAYLANILELPLSLCRLALQRSGSVEAAMTLLFSGEGQQLIGLPNESWSVAASSRTNGTGALVLVEPTDPHEEHTQPTDTGTQPKHKKRKADALLRSSTMLKRVVSDVQPASALVDISRCGSNIRNNMIGYSTRPVRHGLALEGTSNIMAALLQDSEVRGLQYIRTVLHAILTYSNTFC